MPLPINELTTEARALLAWQAPVSKAAGTYVLGPVNMAQCARIVADLDVGAIAGGATVDAKLRASATQGGTYADITGSAITQITASPTGPVAIELKAESLQAANQGPWVELSYTVGTAAVVVGGRLSSFHTAYAPGSDLNNPAYAQKVVV